MYFLDLFSGIGGFALGAYWAGLRFDGHYFSEVDEYAIKIYKQRFPDAVGLGDICKIRGADLPAGDWIVAGGFPCQDISVAGKGAGLAGARSGLWYEYARLIGELRPRYAIMENVGALVGRGLDAVLGSLAALGYDAEWQDIRASDVGAPHRRERIWIVAYPSGARSGREGGEASPYRGRRAGRNESPLRQAHGEDGADRPNPTGATAGHVADASGERCREARELRCDESEEWTARGGEALADPDEIMRNGGRRAWYRRAESTDSREAMADTTDRRNVRRDGELGTAKREVREHRGSPGHGGREWWATEPTLGCLVDGLPDGVGRFEGRTCRQSHERVNQLKCLGNSIVPQIAELIFRQISEDLCL